MGEKTFRESPIMRALTAAHRTREQQELIDHVNFGYPLTATPPKRERAAPQREPDAEEHRPASLDLPA